MFRRGHTYIYTCTTLQRNRLFIHLIKPSRSKPPMSDDGKTPVFLAHRAALGAVARRYHLSREETEDALQELFIKVWEHSRNDVSPGQTRSFLFTALRNICIDLLRKRHTITLEEDAPPGSHPSDSSHAGEASRRRRIPPWRVRRNGHVRGWLLS